MTNKILSDAIPVKQILQGKHSALQYIFSKVQQLQQVNKIFAQYLDPKFKAYCLVANSSATRLVVLLQNATLATPFRFYIPQLLKQLQQHPLLKNLVQIEYKIAPQCFVEREHSLIDK